MKQLSMILAGLFAALFLTGCVAMYKPNVVNSPMLKTKGDGRVSGSLGLIGDGLSNIQASYALTDNVGLMSNAMIHAQESGNADEICFELLLNTSRVEPDFFGHLVR